MKVESDIGQGSRFGFLIPLALPGEKARPTPSSSLSSSSSRESMLSRASRQAQSGEKEIDHIVQALSTHLSGAWTGSNGSIMPNEGVHEEREARPSSVGVFEVAGSQFPIHPVRVDDFASPEPKSAHRSPFSAGRSPGPHVGLSPSQQKQFLDAAGSAAKLRILNVEVCIVDYFE